MNGGLGTYSARWAQARPAHWEPQTDVAGQLSISFASPARKGPIGAPTPVERAQLADDILRVQAAGRLPAGCDILWTVRLSPQYLLRKLRDGIAALDQAPLADKLAADVLDPVRRAPGKTRVLAKAIEDMVRDGKGCCWSQRQNVAVDNALEESSSTFAPSPARVIRVGPPHLPVLAADDVQLHRLAVRTTAEVDAQRVRSENWLTGPGGSAVIRLPLWCSCGRVGS